MTARVLGRVWRGRGGFTLVELMVAVTLCTFVLLGGGELLRQVITASSRSADETVAVVQVQNAGFWVSQDAMQAQRVSRGDPATGFPLTLRWVDWENNEHEITYSVEGTTDDIGRNLWNFTRHDAATNSNVLVAQWLDPVATRCYWHSTLDNVLVFDIRAKVGTASESRTYNIQPRPLR